MTRPVIEPRSPGPLANTLTIMPNQSMTPVNIIIFLLASFSQDRRLMVFHWSLSDCKSPQVSRTLLSILDDLYNAWMVSAGSPISNFSSPLPRLLGSFRAHQLLLLLLLLLLMFCCCWCCTLWVFALLFLLLLLHITIMNIVPLNKYFIDITTNNMCNAPPPLLVNVIAVLKTSGVIIIIINI